MKKILSYFIALFSAAPVMAQLEKTFAITGGTAHLGNGTVIENALILVNNGIIEEVRSETNPRIPKLYRTIDATGKHIYPGLIALGSKLGLVEVEAVRATRDFDEVGDYNAHIRSLIAYNTDSKIIPTLRFNGVLTAQVRPFGGVISGTSSVFKLSGWNWEDAVLKSDDAMWLSWPKEYYQTGWWAEPGVLKKNEQYEQQVREIASFFAEAAAWKGQPANLRLAAMRPVLEGKTQLYIEAASAKDIISAVEFAAGYNIVPVIVGATQSWMIADYLSERKVAVLIDAIHSLPEFPESDYDQPFKTLATLQSKGVLCALANEGSWQLRNLPFMAGTAAGYGLDKENALQLLTGNAAAILGLNNVGIIEKGKSATLLISSGDLLDMRSSNIEQAFIQGEPMSLDDMQQQLYQRFRKKYIDQGIIKP
jgi:imidazolonepropionase-like amidohydrolase